MYAPPTTSSAWPPANAGTATRGVGFTVSYVRRAYRPSTWATNQKMIAGSRASPPAFATSPICIPASLVGVGTGPCRDRTYDQEIKRLLGVRSPATLVFPLCAARPSRPAGRLFLSRDLCTATLTASRRGPSGVAGSSRNWSSLTAAQQGTRELTGGRPPCSHAKPLPTSPVDVPPDSVGTRSCFRSPGIIRSDYSDSRRARISESSAGGRVCERPAESVRWSVGHIDAVHGYGTVPLIEPNGHSSGRGAVDFPAIFS